MLIPESDAPLEDLAFVERRSRSCVVTRRRVGTLLELTDDEVAAVLEAARRVAHALLATFQPLGILTFQNNGAYSGQEVPHYHFHVVPGQRGTAISILISSS